MLERVGTIAIYGVVVVSCLPFYRYLLSSGFLNFTVNDYIFCCCDRFVNHGLYRSHGRDQRARETAIKDGFSSRRENESAEMCVCVCVWMRDGIFISLLLPRLHKREMQTHGICSDLTCSYRDCCGRHISC